MLIGIKNPGSQLPDLESRIHNQESRILDTASWSLDSESRVQTSACGIWDSRPQTLVT
jgi:hypothetical protein